MKKKKGFLLSFNQSRETHGLRDCIFMFHVKSSLHLIKLKRKKKMKKNKKETIEKRITNRVNYSAVYLFIYNRLFIQKNQTKIKITTLAYK